jgi:hypothetical protein
MRSVTTIIMRTLRAGLAVIAALTFSIGLAFAQIATVPAQTDDGTGEAANAPAVAAPPEQPDPAQQAHDDADAAQTALDDATTARDQLEADGASQDQIDAANEAIARARSDKEAADEAAQKADAGQ